MEKLLTFRFLNIYCFLLVSINLFAQELSDDGEVHQINFSGSAEDFIIPSDITYDRIEFFLDGGDGGKGSDCSIKGGKGAQVTAAFGIAPFGNTLRPGGTIRFIVGERGRNRTGSSASGGAGGGGGTAILYKHPGATTDDVPSTNLTNASSDWVILVVAGGGGGAYQRRGSFGGCGSNSKKGQGGRTGTSGGGFGINPGGTNGAGGTAISGLGGAGGGYLAPGVSQSGLFNNDDGKRGGTQGGEGGYFNVNGAPTILGAGGWGYGGGGAGQNLNSGSGGGGGGYSGGGGGLDGNRQGFGGGSFVNNSDIDDFRSIHGDQHIGNPKNGYITYKFFNSNGLIARCKDVTVPLDASSTATFFPVDADDGSYTTDESTILNIYAFPADPPGGVAGFFNFDCTDLGEHEFVLVVVPSQGSIGYCSFNLTVEDHAPPIALCKNTVAELDDFSVNISPSSVDNGSIDACSSHILTLNKQTFNCLNIGNNIVQLTVRDENDNTATCTATVNVIDIGPPQANCSIFPLVVQLDDTGMRNISLNQVLFFDSDNCNVTSRSLSKSSFDCSDLGENIVTATVTDQSGNTGTCTASVTVETGGPTALCQDATIAVDDQGQASLQAAAVDGGSSQLCDLLSLSVNPAAFDCSQLGSQEVTLTVTAQNNDQSTCTATITIEDNTPPVALCKDVTINLGSNGSATRYRGAFNDGSYDNCGSITVLNNLFPIVFDCNSIGTSTITLSISDDNNLTNSCTATATVVDDEPPIATCWPSTVQLDGDGVGNLNPGQVLFISNDACGIQSRTVIPAEFDCDDIGNQQVTVTVTDSNGNVNTCSTSVRVEDNIPPVAVCKDLTINLGSGGVATRNRSTFDDGSYDNCGSVTILNNFSIQFFCDDVGERTVRLTVYDENSNLTNSCNAIATIVDNRPPNVLCQSTTIQLDINGIASLTPEEVISGTGENCGIESQTVSPSNFTCADIGDQEVVVTVTDVNGNSRTCSTSITVEDNEAPVISCQSTTVQLDDTGNGILDPIQVMAGEVENCTIASYSLSQSIFDCTEIGANVVILTATDQNGNTGTCTAAVAVVDEIPPVALCKDLTIDLGFSGVQLRNRGSFNNGSYDNCGSVTVLNNFFPITFDCNRVGTSIINLTVSDGNQTSSCAATATIIDETPPVASCFPTTIQLDDNGVGNLNPGQVLFISSDACGILSRSVSPSEFDCDDIGTQEVTVTVTDNNGNSNTCTTDVLVEDNSLIATCQPANVSLDENGIASITPADIDGGSSSACGTAVSLSLNQMNFDCNDLGANTVILTATDNTGNTANCTANITVEGLPCGWQSDQINCTESTQAGYDPTTGTYNLSAENCYDPNYYSNSDAQSMIQQELCGDGEIIAHVDAIDGDAWAGIFMRESDDPGAKMLQLAINNSGLAQRQLRQSTGSLAYKHLFQNQGKHWLRLTRSGNQFGAFLSLDGISWTPVLMTNTPMTNCIQTGLFVSNTIPGSIATAWFDNVQIIPPLGGSAFQAPNTQYPSVAIGLPKAMPTPNDQHLMTKTQFLNHTDVQVYPNPTSGALNVEIGAFMDQPVEILVLNQQGQILETKLYNENHAPTEKLWLEHLQNGLYFIRIKVKGCHYTKKVNIIH